MNITVERYGFGRASTESNILIDGEFFCHGLEDVVRESKTNTVDKIKQWKIYGQTAIPFGRYRVKIVRSARFKRDMCYLLDVPGFSGILIHNGKGPESTEGCLLVSMTKDFNYNREAMLGIEQMVREAIAKDEEVWIEFLRKASNGGD